jgi:hypothetical protein
MNEDEMGRNIARAGEKIRVNSKLVSKPLRKENIWKT